MDVKGIKWFGNVYQKFETMCLEVEEAVCQDTVKYVENQVQTVGASVKKFYSEVVDDLLSPSLMDPVKVNSLSCTGAHKKPKLGIKEEPKRQLFEDRNATTEMDYKPTYAPSFDRFSNTDPAVPCNPINSTTVSTIVGVSPKKLNLVIKRKPKTVIQDSCTEVLKETDLGASIEDKKSVTSGALKIENIKVPTDQNFEQEFDSDARDSKETRGNKTGKGTQKDFKLKLIADASLKPTKIIVSDGAGTCHPKDSLVGKSSENKEVFKSMHPTDAINDDTNIPPLDTFSDRNDAGTYEESFADRDTKNKEAFGYNNSSYSEEWTAQTEVTEGWNIETITTDDDDDDHDDGIEADAETIEINYKNKNTMLEESCIIVDRDNLPFYPHKEPKHKSYKKKLREAFSSRGKSTIKKEYRQLAAQYESRTCLELKQQCASSYVHRPSSPTTEEKKLKSSNQLCDSEWEIL